jgi:hypothetical protein
MYYESLEKEERFKLGYKDGTFIMRYEDWYNVYNTLYVTVDFLPSWSGIRFSGEWNSNCSGGLPMPVSYFCIIIYSQKA